MDDVYCLDHRFTLIAGGQTGADRAALDWAIAEGVRHGGWCPRGRKTEDGPLPAAYLLQETPASGYLQRTEWNVRDSDATLIFTLSDKLDGGSKRTAQFADRLGKPWLHVRPGVHPKFVARFLALRQVGTLNVAGKRESSAPGIALFVREVLSQALRVQREAAAPCRDTNEV
jgi:hypothetical protein